jgi:hypothetical protein
MLPERLRCQRPMWTRRLSLHRDVAGAANTRRETAHAGLPRTRRVASCRVHAYRLAEMQSQTRLDTAGISRAALVSVCDDHYPTLSVAARDNCTQSRDAGDMAHLGTHTCYRLSPISAWTRDLTLTRMIGPSFYVRFCQNSLADLPTVIDAGLLGTRYRWFKGREDALSSYDRVLANDPNDNGPRANGHSNTLAL